VRSVLLRLATGMNLLPRSLRARSAAGNASKLAPVLSEIQAGGCTSMTLIAGELNARGVPAYLGGQWSTGQVRLLMKRLRLRDARQRLMNHSPGIKSENDPSPPAAVENREGRRRLRRSRRKRR
jgi:hypothetical protein